MTKSKKALQDETPQGAAPVEGQVAAAAPAEAPVAEAAALREIADLRFDLARAEASLETYRSLCRDLLDRLSGTVCASA